MKILLVFPPSAGNFGPYLSLPALAAYLKGKGLHAEQYDLNAHLYDTIFSPDGFSRIRESVRDEFSKLDAGHSLTVEEQETYLDLISGPLSGLETYADRIEAIKHAFKEPGNYEIHSGRATFLEPVWKDYARIKKLVMGEDHFLFNLPSYPLEDLHGLISGRRRLAYQEILFDLARTRIIDPEPRIVGLSFAFTSQVMPGLLLAHFIKKHLPDTHIVVGGPYWTILRESAPGLLSKLPFIDSIGIFEGEHTLAELGHSLQDGRSPAGIPNLITRDYNCLSQKRFSVIDNLDELPCPELEALDLGLYFTPEPVLPYASARGCYYNKCAFCNFHNVSSKFRTRSIDRVTEDLKRLTTRCGKLFYFTQECETPARLNQIASAIMDHGIDIKYQAFVRFDRRYTPEILQNIRASGCQYLFFGLEAANQRVNNFMKKGVDIGHARRILDICHSVGQNVVVSSIRGFPTETQAEFEETRTFYKEIRDRYQDRIRIAGSSHFFRLARGSHVDTHFQNYGLESVHRAASGELSPVYDSMRFKASQGTPPLSDRLAHYHESMPDIFFNEYLVLVMTAFNPDSGHLLETVREKTPAGPTGTAGAAGDINTLNFKLTPDVLVLPCNFNLSAMGKLSAQRHRAARENFFDRGIAPKEILAGFTRDIPPLEQAPCIALINKATGKLLTLSDGVRPVVEFFRQRRTYSDLMNNLNACGSPASPPAVEAFLKKLTSGGILSAREKDPAEKRDPVIS